MKYKNYYVRPITDLRQMLRSSVELFGEKTAFLEKIGGEYRPTTYNQFLYDVERLGEALISPDGMPRRVVIIGDSCYRWALSYMTAVCGLGVAVPVDRELPAEEIANICRLSQASLILYSDSVAEKLAETDIEKYSFRELDELLVRGDGLIRSGRDAYRNAPIDPEIMSVLLFTSGTTGDAKGVMLSQRNICFNLMEMCQMIYIGPEDVFMSVLPLHHTYECTCGFLCQIYRGSAIAYCEKISLVTKNMAETGTTKILCVPLLLESMYKKIWQSVRKQGKEELLRRAIKINNTAKRFGIDLSGKMFADIHKTFGGRLNLMISGGAAVDPEVLSGLRDLGIKAVQGYGLTECAPLAAVSRDKGFRDSSAGLPTPHGRLEIWDNDRGCALPVNETGEVRYKGDNVMLGYYNDPELTAKVLTGGWFCTGDLGYLDSDGFLHITGRQKNVIVTSNGKNIFPEELEVYLERNDYIKDAMVVGEAASSGDTNIKALIYPEFESVNRELAERGITPDMTEEYRAAVRSKFADIINAINLELPTYKRIRCFAVRKKEFDKTTTKKIKRFEAGNLSDKGDM